MFFLKIFPPAGSSGRNFSTRTFKPKTEPKPLCYLISATLLHNVDENVGILTGLHRQGTTKAQDRRRKRASIFEEFPFSSENNPPRRNALRRLGSIPKALRIPEANDLFKTSKAFDLLEGLLSSLSPNTNWEEEALSFLQTFKHTCIELPPFVRANEATGGK